MKREAKDLQGFSVKCRNNTPDRSHFFQSDIAPCEVYFMIFSPLPQEQSLSYKQPMVPLRPLLEVKYQRLSVRQNLSLVL